MNLSDAERQRRSDFMRALNAAGTWKEHRARRWKRHEDHWRDYWHRASKHVEFWAYAAARQRHDEPIRIERRSAAIEALRSALARDPSHCYWGA